VLKDKSFADVMEERITNDPTLRQPFDATVPYAELGTPRKLYEHVDAYKELNARLLVDFGVTESEIPEPPVQQ
jgi:hypothetical protein